MYDTVLRVTFINRLVLGTYRSKDTGAFAVPDRQLYICRRSALLQKRCGSSGLDANPEIPAQIARRNSLFARATLVGWIQLGDTSG